MNAPAMKSILVRIGPPIALAVIVGVGWWLDAIWQTRLFGSVFVLIGVWGSFAPNVRVSFGDAEVGRLRGWHKAWVLIPTATLGLLVVTCAPQIVCFSRKYQPLCA